MRKLHKLLGLALATALCATTVMATASCGNNSEGKPGIVVKGTGDTIAVIAKGETPAFWQACFEFVENHGLPAVKDI